MKTIIPGKFCADCLDEDEDSRVPAVHEWDDRGPDSGGLFLCDGCAMRRYDEAQARDFESYHGGSGPQTLAEQYQAAAQVKREQR